jgi:hypothetical protein
MNLTSLQSPRECPAANAKFLGDLIEGGVAHVEFRFGLFELGIAELSGASQLLPLCPCSGEPLLGPLDENVPLELGEGTQKHEHEFSRRRSGIETEVGDVQIDPALVQGIKLGEGICHGTIGTVERIDDECIPRLKGGHDLLIDRPFAGDSGDGFDEELIGQAFQPHDLAVMALFGRGNAQISKPLHEPLKNNEYQVVMGLIIDGLGND